MRLKDIDEQNYDAVSPPQKSVELSIDVKKQLRVIAAKNKKNGKSSATNTLEDEASMEQIRRMTETPSDKAHDHFESPEVDLPELEPQYNDESLVSNGYDESDIDDFADPGEISVANQSDFLDKTDDSALIEESSNKAVLSSLAIEDVLKSISDFKVQTES
jgi:hypothetical protein